MSKSFFRQFQNEDWIATLMGLLLVVTVIVLPGLIPVFPKELNTVGAWLSILGLLVVALLVAALGVRLLGERLKGFLPAFVAIFRLFRAFIFKVFAQVAEGPGGLDFFNELRAQDPYPMVYFGLHFLNVHFRQFVVHALVPPI